MDVKTRIVTAALLLVAAKGVGVGVPFAFKWTVDALTLGPEALPPLVVAAIATPPSLMLAYGFARATQSALNEGRNAMFSSVTQAIVRRVSSQVFAHLHRLDLEYHLGRQTGGLARSIDRGTRGINFILGAMIFNVVPTAFEVALVSGILAAKCGPLYAGLTSATIGAYTWYTFSMTSYRTRIRKEMNQFDSEGSTRVIDSLINFETVKYFGNERHEVDRYGESLQGVQKTMNRTQESLAALNFGQQAIFTAAVTAAMMGVTYDIMAGRLTVGDLVMVNTLLLQVAVPLHFLGTVYRESKQSLVDMSSLFSLLEITPAIQDAPGAKDLVVPARGGLDLTLDHAAFAYGATSRVSSYGPGLSGDRDSKLRANNTPRDLTIPGEDNNMKDHHHGAGDYHLVRGDNSTSTSSTKTGSRTILRDVSLHIPAGTTCAIVGSSGSGKSTILRLLFRLLDTSGGAVRVGGQDVRDVTMDSLRRQMAVVPQDTVLFHDTIRYNIRYGRLDASDEEVEEVRFFIYDLLTSPFLFSPLILPHRNSQAARMAHIHDAVMQLPDGYETRVGERGLKLSGGEKQRVALARAFLKNPKVLLCDEATSALDSRTERDIMESLNALAVGRTCVFVAHRLTTAARCDQIVVLEQGRVVESGTHHELLRGGGKYAEMWAKQGPLDRGEG